MTFKFLLPISFSALNQLTIEEIPVCRSVRGKKSFAVVYTAINK